MTTLVSQSGSDEDDQQPTDRIGSAGAILPSSLVSPRSTASASADSSGMHRRPGSPEHQAQAEEQSPCRRGLGLRVHPLQPRTRL